MIMIMIKNNNNNNDKYRLVIKNAYLLYIVTHLHTGNTFPKKKS